MPLPERAHIGPYEIVGWLGAGGMGEVYGARDSRLGRQVAIKLIRDTFATDSSRVRRFEQEARAAGQLNHPNVLAVYDVGIHDGAPYIVSELLEGESLRSQLQVADLPWRRAVDYARQIAEGLAAAHDKGIVHLDVKPDNLFVTNNGRIKILDFGIAKLTHAGDDVVGNADETDTAEVTVMGTAGYMSPEQVRGEPLDARSDIFSMGSILYEMLAGHPAFARKTAADTMAAILKEEPPPRLSTNAPPALERIVSRCLEKSREARFQSARDLAFSLDVLSGATTATPMATVASPAPAAQWQVARWLATLSIIAVVVMAGLVFRRPTATDAPEMRFQIAMSLATYPTSVSISPDGRRVVSSVTAETGAQLSLRALGSDIAQPLPGTDGAVDPFWSPDNRSIGFFANGRLKRIDIDSGVVQTLASVPSPRGGTWSSEGTILFGIASGPLYRVPARGGTAIPATHLLPDQTSYRYPHLLPDGRRFLVFVLGTPASQGIYVGSLDQTDARRLPIDAESEAEFLPPGHVAFVRHGALWAERVDFERMQPIGEPFLVARQVLTDADYAAKAAFATSEVGSVVYRANDGERQLSWLDRAGHEVGTVGGMDSSQQADIRLSSDGRTVALLRTVDGNRDVWLVDTARGFPHRLTSDPALEELPFLSRDGSLAVFTSTRTRGVADLYERSVNSDANDRLLLESSEQKNSQDLSPDGRYLLYTNQAKETGFDLWVLPLFGDRKPEVVVRTSYNENRARFSPDGGWIAYQSNETGQNEIYVHPFHRPGDAMQVSSGGGSDATWSHDGREVFYIGRNNHLMAVPVSPRGSTMEAGTPVGLFSLSPGSEYAPSPDGRFLINRSVRDSSPITILLNWKGPKQ